MASGTLEKERMVLKNRGTNDFPKEGRGVMEDEVEFQLGRVIEGEKNTTIVGCPTSRGLTRRKPTGYCGGRCKHQGHVGHQR